ncbi:hypothetical protein MSLAZ_2857 [Methanosarcina lacustris Z-7289]|uniref:Uncharacterized protein n=1 Tax=Methanosarcina lacustris Z-7289 TaxID=1434111 RepID=A0A0E3SA83_9EURY|nr:hypothetical protein MSLAZ_2857 [Methanosarcina lacustris Z-7289]
MLPPEKTALKRTVRVQQEFSKSSARVQQEFSKSSARVQQEFSKSTGTKRVNYPSLPDGEEGASYEYFYHRLRFSKNLNSSKNLYCRRFPILLPKACPQGIL